MYLVALGEEIVKHEAGLWKDEQYCVIKRMQTNAVSNCLLIIFFPV